MKLLKEIIDSVTAEEEPISKTLRRCLVLAYKLQNDRLKAWVEAELNGYPDQGDLPDYRQARGTAKGLFLGPMQAELRNQPLPPAIMKPEHRHWATDIRLTQPIAAYDTRDEDKTAILQWPQDLVVMYQTNFYRGYALNRAWMEIPGSMIAGLVDTVRTRVLTLALEIQSELPEDTEQAVEQIPAATVEKLVHVHIYGGNNVVGDVSEFNAPTVIAGSPESLQTALKALGVQDEDIKQLEASLQEDGTYTVDKADPKPVGNKTLGWIGKAAKKVGGGAAKISGAVAEEAIRAAVMRYLGF